MFLALMTATQPNLYELWRLRLFSFGGYGLALAALALMVFGAIVCPPHFYSLNTILGKFAGILLIAFFVFFPRALLLPLLESRAYPFNQLEKINALTL